MNYVLEKYLTPNPLFQIENAPIRKMRTKRRRIEKSTRRNDGKTTDRNKFRQTHSRCSDSPQGEDTSCTIPAAIDKLKVLKINISILFMCNGDFLSP